MCSSDLNVRFANASSESVIASTICEAPTPGTGTATAPTIATTATTGSVTCSGSYVTLGK